MKQTTYQCCQQGKDVNKSLSAIHCEDTEVKALCWLSANGGGVYRNILHNFQFEVKPGDYPK